MNSQQIVDIFSALLTPAIGIIGVIILINQYRLARLRWRLGLYDKRYPVFISTMEYLTYLVQNDGVTNDELFKFLRNSKDKEFLFGEDVKKHLDELYHKGREVKKIESILENEPVGEKRTNLVDRKDELVEWFQQQFGVSKTLFGKYLRIDKK